jgi:hypothetical protein
MPGETPGAKLPSPWKDFLGEIDKALEKPLEIHCIEGFALVFYYGIPRTTGDIDYYTAVPSDLNLKEIAGHDSDLASQVQDLSASCHGRNSAGRVRRETFRYGEWTVRTA